MQCICEKYIIFGVNSDGSSASAPVVNAEAAHALSMLYSEESATIWSALFIRYLHGCKNLLLHKQLGLCDHDDSLHTKQSSNSKKVNGTSLELPLLLKNPSIDQDGEKKAEIVASAFEGYCLVLQNVG